MERVRIRLRIFSTTPSSVGAGGAEGTLADKTVVRDGRGNFILPGSHVKGRLRHACEQILRSQDVPICRAPTPETMCPRVGQDDAGREFPRDMRGEPRCLLCDLFGSPGHPGRLRFQDLRLDTAGTPAETIRTMVSLNRRRKTAQAQRLFFVETAPHVEGLSFSREDAVIGYAASRAGVQLLLAGWKLMYAWGGGNSRGLGWGQAEPEVFWGEAETPVAIEAEALKEFLRAERLGREGGTCRS